MNMMMNPTHCPLLIAALAALCGVCLIAFSNVHPTTSGSDQHDRAPQKQQLERHQRALAALQNAGVSGIVDIVDFGDGLGLGVTRNVEAGTVLLRVPDVLALDLGLARSCTEGGPEPVALDCQIERAVANAVSRNETTNMVGLIASIVMERRRGSTPGLQPIDTSDVIATLPELSWQQENGLFAVDEEEFRVFSVGTSMEGWRDLAVNVTAAAHSFISEKLPMLEGVSLQEVRWAYLMLQSHAQWAEENVSDDFQIGLDLPAGVHFLWPLFLARPTPEWQHGVHIRYDQDSRVYEVVSTHAMRAGDEVHFVDRRLSDASVLSFQGLWLTGRHRMRLTLNVSSARRDADSQSTLQKYNCGAQPLQLYVVGQKSVDAHFMSCMRMLALASNHTRLKRAQKKGWLDKWPVTGMVDQKTEAAATELGINALQQVLGRLGSSSTQMRQRFGNDAAAARPTVHVREAETMIVVGLLKSMKELQLVSSSEYLFEAMRESEKTSGRPNSARQTGRR